MKAVARRLDRLEDQFGYANGKAKKGIQIACSSAAARMTIDASRCMELLEEFGFLPTGREMTVVDLRDIPNDLDVEGTKRYLRERGAEMCGLSRT